MASAAVGPPLVELQNDRTVGHVSHMPYRPVVERVDFHRGTFREKKKTGAAPNGAALAQRRLEALTGVPILPVDEAILEIAEEILRKAILPRSASVDALHIAMVAHHQVDYLLTWNCTHIANARILPKVFGVLDSAGLARPIICTPEELLNDDTEIS